MIHHVFANKSNIGDWLSARGIQGLLGAARVTEHLCDKPFVARTLESLSAAKPKDVIVIGGGGLFMDYFTPFWRGFRQIAKRVPFCIWGVGYCDLKREPSRASEGLLEEIVRGSQICVVRDELSRRCLSRCALPPPVPCPSICAVARCESASRGLLHVDNYTTAGAATYEAMDEYGREFAKRTQRNYRTTNNRIQPGSEVSLQAVMKLYASADMVLSSGLHGCVLALAMGRKVLAVSGDRKIESFMAAAGLSEWVCDAEAVGAVPDLLANLNEQPSVDSFVEEARRANRAVAAELLAMAELA